MAHIHRIVAGNVNCYVAAGEGGALLIDTGTQKYREKVLKMCRAFHVRLIVLTHGHFDHCQNAAYLAGALHIPIAIHKKDMELISDNRVQPLLARTVPGKIVRAASLHSFEKQRVEAFQPAFYLKQGDRLDEYGINAEVVELPGHTNGSIGLTVEGDKLFVGDALMNMFYPTVSMLYTNEQKMRSSAAWISSLGKMAIYFGHGSPRQNREWAV